MMKRIVFMCVAILFILSSNVYAHPPGKVSVAISGDTVTVNVIHGVMNTNTHFIFKINVAVNATEMITQRFTKQPRNRTFSVSYTIPSLQKGDVISAEAFCNKRGTKTGQATVK